MRTGEASRTLENQIEDARQFLHQAKTVLEDKIMDQLHVLNQSQDIEGIADVKTLLSKLIELEEQSGELERIADLPAARIKLISDMAKKISR